MSKRKLEDYSLGQRIAKLVAKYSKLEGKLENGEASVRGSIDIARLVDEALFDEAIEHEQSESCKKSEIQLPYRNTSSGSI